MPRKATAALLAGIGAVALVAGAVSALAGEDSGSSSVDVGQLASPIIVDANWNSPTTTSEPAGDQPEFEDTFDGPLSKDRWTTCYWWATDGCKNGSSGEAQWYVDSQVSVNDGTLRLEASDERITNQAGDTFDFRSGMVTTGRRTDNLSVDPKFAFTYGRVEVRADVPKGKGFWPAIWLLPITHESIPEIDIIEVYGDATDTARFTTHFDPTESGRTTYGERPDVVDIVGDLGDGFHTYGITWSANAIEWDIDGVGIWSVDRSEVIPSEPMYLLMNLAVGGGRPGMPDDSTPFPSTFEIDSVRIWSDDVYASGGDT